MRQLDLCAIFVSPDVNIQNQIMQLNVCAIFITMGVTIQNQNTLCNWCMCHIYHHGCHNTKSKYIMQLGVCAIFSPWVSQYKINTHETIGCCVPYLSTWMITQNKHIWTNRIVWCIHQSGCHNAKSKYRNPQIVACHICEPGCHSTNQHALKNANKSYTPKHMLDKDV